jgi:D-glycero-D-manno-heptose 1,7-bisphosphate phosphatase
LLRRAVFLDRDGTLITERFYLADPDQVELVPGVGNALRALASAGFALVLVTNQSGIARGLYQERDFHAVQQRLNALLLECGISLDGVYFCPHHPEFSGPCDCRKPAPGMYQQAARDLALDLGRSVYVGDRVKDVLAALEFGGLGVLVRTGFGNDEAGSVPMPVRVARDLTEAAGIILDSVPAKSLDS